MRNIFMIFMVVVAVLTGTGCATTTSAYSPFKVDQEKFFSTIETIALAPTVVPAELAASEQRISQFESLVVNKLREAGFTVVLSHEYRDIWKRENQLIGGCFDSATGRMDATKFRKVQERTCQELEKQFNVDAILLVDILVVKANFRQFEAEWDGAEESFDVRHGVLQFFDTSTTKGTVGALSMRATIKDMDGVALYVNQGGIQVLSKYGSGGFAPVPVNALLTSEERNIGAVNIALGPLDRNPSVEGSQEGEE